MPNTASNITVLIETFAIQITAAVEAAMADKLQAALAGAFGAPKKRGPGRPPKQISAAVTPVAAKPTPARKAAKATPKVARARKIQGQYLGAWKSLSGANRAKVRAVARDQSVADAVKLALSLKKAKA